MTIRLLPKLGGRSRCFYASLLLGLCALAALIAYFADNENLAEAFLMIGGGRGVTKVKVATSSDGLFLELPQVLLERGIYQNDSFINEAGIIPAFWEGRSNQTFLRDRRNTYGPCYGYDTRIDWGAEIERYNRTHEPQYNEERINRPTAMDLRGYCRPGFIIIGAGKCGTSSLYHYIAAHPRVLPASEKQIHYFKYHTQAPLKWYYSHFPKTSSFLAAGALMSGEASPGYLPYPDVIIEMKRTMPKPRLLMIGRNPIERSYSSYKYNYLDPTIKFLKKGFADNGIQKGRPDDYYKQFLYSFEDMMKAELAVLRECFAPGSEAEIETRKRWQKTSWVDDEYKRREDFGLPPLIDLDGYCYGSKVNNTVLRKQWAEMVAAQPNKILLDRNLHLTQAFIGRSLYLFPLEWWYAAFPNDHLYFVCTEELQDFSGEPMNSVGEFLGLPRFDNFSEVVKGGAFNVGGHKGYDTEISWDKIEHEHAKDEIPLSVDLRSALEDFIKPYNERLFSMTGRRCKW